MKLGSRRSSGQEGRELPAGNVQGDRGGSQEETRRRPEHLRLPDAGDQGAAGTGRDVAGDHRVAEPAGHKTTAGKPFTQTAVWRLIDRYLGKE